MSHTHSYRSDAGAAHSNATVASWLSKAAGDLSLAERELTAGAAGNTDAVCFHAQQAAVKIMKAALIAAGPQPPKTHDLVHLDALLQRQLLGWSWDVGELSELTSAAVEVRYPGFTASMEDAARMLDIAARIWAVLRPRV
ncbi:MAG: HEPN domain-containing protein [Dehalococcoidia bacterium]